MNLYSLPVRTRLFLMLCGAGLALVQPAATAAAEQREQRTLPSFSAVEASGPYTVVIQAQGPSSVELTGPRNQLDEVETEVRGATLMVRPRKRTFGLSFSSRENNVTVRIRMPQLERLSNKGSGTLEVSQVRGERLTVDSGGSGDVRISGSVRSLTLSTHGSGNNALRQLQADSVTLDMHGSGDVTLAGLRQQLRADIGGSGNLDVADMRTTRVDVALHGSGDARLSGSGGDLHAELSGSGDLLACGLSVDSVSTQQRGSGDACVSGTIKKFEAEVRGSGDLTVRGLQAPQMRARLAGSGTITLAGSGGTLDADLNGSGDLEARDLLTQRAEVRVHGSGEALVNVKTKAGDAAGPSRLVRIDREGARQIN
jgi:hypothetical protein